MYAFSGRVSGLVIIVSSLVSFVEGGQECLSCSNMGNINGCQHYISCANNEVCYKHKYITESGSLIFDFGCAMPETCNHLIGSIFGKRSEGHHLKCSACCNHTRLCNKDVSCSSVHPTNTQLPRECSEINVANPKSGVYTIYPDGTKPVPVYCKMIDATTKWTIIQRRINGFVNFSRGWEAYKEGFGNVNGEYWLGNENIHEITSHGNHKLRIELSDFDGNTTYAEYQTFDIGDEHGGYQLLVLGYSGDAGDSLAYHNGMKFSTFDRDNDVYAPANCAVFFSGAWWFRGCHNSNLNGKYLAGHHLSIADGIEWHAWHGFAYSLKTSTMMITSI